MRQYLKRRAKVLSLLYQCENNYLSGEKLSEELGVSRTTIWKYINHFRKAGYQIESSSRRGYKLINSPDILLPEEIKRNLSTERIGRNIFHYDKVESTNKIAKEQAKQGSEEGTIIIAEKQVGGRGRMGREFCSPRGGIWLSCILKPSLTPVLATRATYLASLAVVKTIRELTELEPLIKWPNDVLINGKKVSGILTEMGAELDQVNYLVIGMGINVNFSLDDIPEELHKKVTTLVNELGEEVNRVKFVQHLLKIIEELYPLFQNFNELVAKWKNYSYTLGKEVQVKEQNNKFKGKAVGIASDGGLILELAEGRKTVYSGEVSLAY